MILKTGIKPITKLKKRQVLKNSKTKCLLLSSIVFNVSKGLKVVLVILNSPCTDSAKSSKTLILFLMLVFYEKKLENLNERQKKQLRVEVKTINDMGCPYDKTDLCYALITLLHMVTKFVYIYLPFDSFIYKIMSIL